MMVIFSLDEARAVHDNEQYELESERSKQAQLLDWEDDHDVLNHNLPESMATPQVCSMVVSRPSKVLLRIFQWVEQKRTAPAAPTSLSHMTIEDKDRERLRVQDKELMQMTDDGMCLSMHQPWGSLLVRGIKM